MNKVIDLGVANCRVGSNLDGLRKNGLDYNWSKYNMSKYELNQKWFEKNGSNPIK